MQIAECFIIMPVSTPANLQATYASDSQHFLHVLQHLFLPAVTAAGFSPLLPTVEGSRLIHAEIVQRLASADMVLCDMSALNPNVFFELGIRTALNRPVALVKDDVTTPVPFDTAFINYYEYKSTLAPWRLSDEVDRLTRHIEQSFPRSDRTNALWKYFGLQTAAHMYQPADVEGGIESINVQLQHLRNAIGAERGNDQIAAAFHRDPLKVFSELSRHAAYAGHHIHLGYSSDDRIEVYSIQRRLSRKLERSLQNLANSFGYTLTINVR
jgi:hypothetical protein